MLRAKNNWKIVLCFVNGNPHLYNKKTKVYTVLHITTEDAFEIIKQNLVITPTRPNMKEIWQYLTMEINCCDGYSSYFKKCNHPNSNSFENIVTKKITHFLNEFYPPEVTAEQARKKREYEENKRKNDIAFEGIKKAIRNKQIAIKNGKRPY